ncbi:MAG: peptidylprolyl isomerase [Planctomycetota bacterium]|nr:peptidylprolyl isomerase [Planctomycetota bacterium]
MIRATYLVPLLALALLAVPACGGESSDESAKETGATPEAPTPGAVIPGMTGEPAPEVDPGPAPETVIVTVDGKPITQGEIDEELRGMLFGGMKVEPARLAMVRKQFGSQAENRLIDQRLLENAVAKEGIEASTEELAKRWKEIEARIPAGMDKAVFLKSKGFTVEEAERRIMLGMKMEKLLEKHAASATVDDAALKTYYDANILQFQTPEQVHARHILLKVAPGDTEEQKATLKKQIEGFKAEVAEKGPGRFQELAKEHSACPSKAEGGSLGFFGRGQMVPEFDKVAFVLEPGTVSDPVLTQFGWHILLVEEKREAGTRTLDEVKEQLKARLEQEGKQKAQTTYVESLRKAATIERSTTAPATGK